jgi:hypothetical protein
VINPLNFRLPLIWGPILSIKKEVTMQFTTENITWNFKKGGNDMMSDEETLGLSYLYIPEGMVNRFKRECGHKDELLNRLLLPHYDIDYVDIHIYARDSTHECYNSDTQIVLMSWLLNKKRKYVLDYQGLDPYWIFHDTRHTLNDVYSWEVSGITSHTEHYRLFEGAEYALKHGIHISADTVYKLSEAWIERWRIREWDNYTKLNPYEFKPFMLPEEFDLLQQSIEFGESLKELYEYED